MAFIEVNACRMYYETFGVDQPGQAPVVLIHGSTQTGQSCWQFVAPLLSRRRRVIVPDCRGHGQSDNPTQSYSFKELADDIAGLVKALGYPRAQIIGHSNGGNIALVTLLEHPEVVQSAVIQAANAYVSPDLVEKEPAIFDPERVAREAPDWRSEMIALHGETHGAEYWRELLRLTVAEIISQPNYTPADLAAVERPALVIQGEQDRVNAPAGHAQFIARYLPQAELWLPEKIGHNVHDEILFEWIERVEDFLERRGDDWNECLDQLKRERYPDERQTVFQPRIQLSTTERVEATLSGQVLEEEQRNATMERLQALGLPLTSERLQVLRRTVEWALVRRGVTDLRRSPSNRAERVSQALFGEAVQVLETRGEWAWVQHIQDGYLGWIQIPALECCTESTLVDYQTARNACVQAELLPVFNMDGGLAGKLPFGARLFVEEWQEAEVLLRLPGGERWKAPRVGVLPNPECPQPTPVGIEIALQAIRRFIGVPYLWGGRTPFGYDCSGLAQAFHAFLGCLIPRDADQQFRAALPVEGEPRPGDLLFFGRHDPFSPRYASITHVAISLGGSEIIHANGATWSVAYNSLNPLSPIYRAALVESLAGIGRFL